MADFFAFLANTDYQGKSGGAANTILKLFSKPEIRARVIRIKEMLEGEG
jgi:hypothetical protein